MKKLLAILLSAAMLLAISVPTFASDRNLIPETSNTVYQFASSSTGLTPGVTLYDGSTKFYSAANAGGSDAFAIFYDANCGWWQALDNAVQLCKASSRVRIKFNGTAFKLGSTQNNVDTPTSYSVLLDGVSQIVTQVPANTLGGVGPKGSEKGVVICDLTGLTNGVHVVDISCSNATESEAILSWFEIDGTLVPDATLDKNPLVPSISSNKTALTKGVTLIGANGAVLNELDFADGGDYVYAAESFNVWRNKSYLLANSGVAFTNTGCAVEIEFYGTGIAVGSSENQGSEFAEFSVTLDGVLQPSAKVPNYNVSNHTYLYTNDSIPLGNHTVRISAVNPNASNCTISWFEVNGELGHKHNYVGDYEYKTISEALYYARKNVMPNTTDVNCDHCGFNDDEGNPGETTVLAATKLIGTQYKAESADKAAKMASTRYIVKLTDAQVDAYSQIVVEFFRDEILASETTDCAYTSFVSGEDTITAESQDCAAFAIVEVATPVANCAVRAWGIPAEEGDPVLLGERPVIFG